MQKGRRRGSRISLGRALMALAVVLVAINIAAAVWDAREAYTRLEQRILRDLGNVTGLLAGQTAATLETVDVVLRDLARGGDPEGAARSVPRLGDEVRHVSAIAALLVLDAGGRVVARAGEMPAIDLDLARHLGAALQGSERGAEVQLSEPFKADAEGKRWRFLVARRLGASGAASRGTVLAALEIGEFERLYRGIDLGEDGFVALMTAAGTILSRVPYPDAVRGAKIPLTPPVTAVRESGRFDGWMDGPLSGRPLLLSVRAVPGFPLFVASGNGRDAVLAAWRAEAWQIFDRTLLTSAAMLLLMSLAAWGLARRERALGRTWQRYQAMIEHSSDALVLTRPQSGGIAYASPAMERVLGYSAGDLRGRQVMDLVHPEMVETALRLREELLRTPGKVILDEVRMRHKDGSWRWVELTLKNLLGEPSVDAIVMNVRDIDERKHAEAERARLEQRLRQAEKMEAVGRLAGGIAHDFNNLLGGILGYAELLAEHAPAGTPLKRYADNVLTAASRASGLVDQILSYSRSQRGKRVPVDLAQAVAETLELVRGSLPSEIALEADLSAPLYVVGDETQLHQVTMNLCTNALHAMGAGGKLRVTLQSEDVAGERALSHSMLRAGQYVRLSVEDSGSGMDAATMEHIFEPFFTTREVGKGTGLGLSLVYGIVTDSGGAIDVSSAPGHGSRFSIFLPRVDTPATSRDRSTVPLPRGGGERVLVVDDEEVLVAVTAEVLRHIGYEPVGCSDAGAALAAFSDGAIDAVVADEVMPGMTGTQLAQALRRRRADLPFVLVSGYTGPMLVERALAVGVTEVLKKPVQSRDLADALARVLRRT
ncbi:MAG TPA: ATP-binding protein [Burkholderiales bacterium]|nr:ATP-binding protein [Burkholderiales bacterium]